jgi:predicted DNA-binding protein
MRQQQELNGNIDRIAVYLPKELGKKVREFADRNSKSLSYVTSEILEKFFTAEDLRSDGTAKEPLEKLAEGEQSARTAKE